MLKSKRPPRLAASQVCIAFVIAIARMKRSTTTITGIPAINRPKPQSGGHCADARPSFQHAGRWARGTVLDTRLTCATFAASDGERFPDLVSAAVLAEDGNSLALFCVNRNFDQAIDVAINLCGFESSALMTMQTKTRPV